MYRSIDAVKAEMARLPQEEGDRTARRVTNILLRNRTPDPRATTFYVILQRQEADLRVDLGIIHTNGVDDHYLVNKSEDKGVPLGAGALQPRLYKAAKASAEVRQEYLRHPRQKLLQVLEKETKARPTEIGPPFSVIFMHNDGSMQNFSQKTICSIPDKAK